MVNNGLIKAPVSVADVRDTLGEQSNDIGTLCMSENINPYSLIRPFATTTAGGTKRPYLNVKDLKTAQIGAPMTSDIAVVHWERKLWGYQVPYATSPAQFVQFARDVSWYREGPTESDYKNLAHFDGYRHNAMPMFGWFAHVVSGEEITILFQFGEKQTNIVSESGVGNNGGVVSIPEVFGDAPFYFGCTISAGSSTTNYFNDTPIDPNSMQMFGLINTGRVAQSNVNYEITPWICDKPRSGNSLPINAKYFSLKFSEDYESHKIIQTPAESVSLALFVTEEIETGLGGVRQFRIMATNTYMANFLVSGLTLHIEEYRDPNLINSPLPEKRERTESVGKSLYVGGKDNSEMYWDVVINLSPNYPTARMWLTGRATRQGGVSYWEEVVSNMVIATSPQR